MRCEHADISINFTMIKNGVCLDCLSSGDYDRRIFVKQFVKDLQNELKANKKDKNNCSFLQKCFTTILCFYYDIIPGKSFAFSCQWSTHKCHNTEFRWVICK